MNNTLKAKMKYWWTALYCPLYMLCFMLIEKRNQQVTIVSIGIDHKIPFLEIFIVPYLIWFPYIVGMFLIFFFKDKEEFIRMIKYLYIGMTLFIIISYLFPNGLDIRPAYFERDNIFVRLVQMIYRNDTSTNVVPSIHAYNSIVVMIAALKSEKVLTKSWQKQTCCVISVLIVLSTVFVKQHSVLDVFAAMALAWAGYQLFYKKTESVSERIQLRMKGST